MTDEERMKMIDGTDGIEIVPGGGVWIKRLPIVLLVDAKENPRAIKKAARKALDGMLEGFGLVDVLQFNRRTGELVGGHQRIDWLRRRGVTEVAVAVLDLDETHQRALNVGLNNPKAQGHFTDGLAGVLATVAPIVPQLYEQTGLSALLSRSEVAGHERTTVTVDTGDDASEIEPRVAEGDAWELGGSRLVCGDSTTNAAVDRAIDGLGVTCVITDPPYAIYGSSTGVASDVSDDKMVRPFFEAVWRQIFRVLPKFGHAYLCCDWRSWAAVWESAKRAGMSPKNMLVWDKGGGGLGSSYANTFELIAFFARLPKQHSMRGDNETGQRMVHRPNILRFSKPSGDERQHNAAKPVEMLKELISNSSDEGAGILDMFGGSGSTLIASHQLGRRCAMLEVEPGQCDRILARFERVTGGKAIRL